MTQEDEEFNRIEMESRIKQEYVRSMMSAQFMSISVDDYMKLSEELAMARVLVRELGDRLAKLEQAQKQEPWPEEPAGHMAGGVKPSNMTRSKAITQIYALFGAPHNADINLTGLSMLLDELMDSSPKQKQERNFCERCGKRLVDGHIHTCTPPAEQAQKQEPVATVAEVHMSRYTIEWTKGPLPEGTQLYTSPPQRQWVGLTDEDIDNAINALFDCEEKTWRVRMRAAIEAAHGIKE